MSAFWGGEWQSLEGFLVPFLQSALSPPSLDSPGKEKKGVEGLGGTRLRNSSPVRQSLGELRLLLHTWVRQVEVPLAGTEGRRWHERKLLLLLLLVVVLGMLVLLVTRHHLRLL